MRRPARPRVTFDTIGEQRMLVTRVFCAEATLCCGKGRSACCGWRRIEARLVLACGRGGGGGDIFVTIGL